MVYRKEYHSIGSKMGWLEKLEMVDRQVFGWTNGLVFLPFVMFSLAFFLSLIKEATVGDVWGLRDGVHGWVFSWRRRLFVWEDGLINYLLLVLHDFRSGQSDDVWWWIRWREGFLVQSSYQVLLERFGLGEDLSVLEEVIFKFLWKSTAPSKVIAFS